MRQFIRTSVPAEGYEEVKQVGEMYVVHLEPSGVDQQTGTLTCYETTTATEPDIEELTAELQEWKEYMSGRELAIKKQVKIAALVEYDKSNAVNEFSVVTQQRTVTDWLDTQRRGNAQRAIDAAKKTGVQQLDYVVGGVPVTLTTDDADMKLAQLEMYAVTCAAVTERHKATIANLLTAEAVEEYDYTVGYPQKLMFQI